MITEIIKQRHAAYKTPQLQLLLAKVGLQMGYLAHFIQQRNDEEAAPIATGLRASLREWETYA